MSSTMMCSLQMLSLLSRQRFPEDSGKSMHSLFQVNFQHGEWANKVPSSFRFYSVQLSCSEGTRRPMVTFLGLPSLCTTDNPMAQRQGLRVNCYLASYWPQPFVPNKVWFAHVLVSFQPEPHIPECSQKRQHIRTKPPCSEYIETLSCRSLLFSKNAMQSLVLWHCIIRYC